MTPMRSRLSVADVAGFLVFIMPILLGGFMMTGIRLAEFAMYGILAIAILPFIGPFIGSMWKSPANFFLAMFFGALVTATVAHAIGDGTTDQWLGLKSLAATIAWSSIYVVTFIAVRTSNDLERLMRWVHVTSALITLSVYLAALGHIAGFSFGEVLVFRDGRFRAFGPLGDQVAFVLLLPILQSLSSGRPLAFGFYLGAMLLTGTRGAILCLAVGIGIYLFFVLFSSKRRQLIRRPWKAVVATVGVAAAIIMSPMSAVVFDRWTEPSFRMAAMQLGLDAVRDNPLSGLGFNGLEGARPAVAEDWYTPEIAANGLARASNQFIQTATDGGILALFFLLMLVCTVLLNAVRVMRSPHCTSAVFGAQLWLIAVLVGNQTSLWILSDTATGLFVFAVAGLGARAHLLTARERSVARTKSVGSRLAMSTS